MIMEITLLIMEKSWKSHGILFLNYCGNPVIVSALVAGIYRLRIPCVVLPEQFLLIFLFHPLTCGAVRVVSTINEKKMLTKL